LLTPSKLRDELLRDDYRATARALRAETDDPPVFVRLPTDSYGVGHPIEQRRAQLTFGEAGR
jgi:hypothetical protein